MTSRCVLLALAATGIAFYCVTLLNVFSSPEPLIGITSLKKFATASAKSTVMYNPTLERAKNVAFYNLYMKNSSDVEIAQEQLDYLNASGVLGRLHRVYYVIIDPTLASSGSNNVSNTSQPKREVSWFRDGKYKKIKSISKGTELYTLQRIHDYCGQKDNEGANVLYFHSKGSYQKGPNNDNFRLFLDRFTLHTGCMDALEKGYDTCGWRMSPVPFPHYSGNYWWARCRYIRTLIPPASLAIGSEPHDSSLAKMIAIYKKKPYYDKNKVKYFSLPEQIVVYTLGFERFCAEAWLMTARFLNAADCMPVPEYSSKYLFGYVLIPKAMHMARTMVPSEILHRLNCTSAAVNVSTASFAKVFNITLQAMPFSDINTLTLRTRLWTGHDPESIIRLRAKFGEVLTI